MRELTGPGGDVFANERYGHESSASGTTRVVESVVVLLQEAERDAIDLGKNVWHDASNPVTGEVQELYGPGVEVRTHCISKVPPVSLCRGNLGRREATETGTEGGHGNGCRGRVKALMVSQRQEWRG